MKVARFFILGLMDDYMWDVDSQCVPEFCAGVVEVPFSLVLLDLQQLLLPCRGL